MTNETIQRFDKLRSRLFEINKNLAWVDDWEKELYREDDDPRVPDLFDVTIRRNMLKCVLQRKISREDVECEVQAYRFALESEKAAIEKEIEEL